MKKIIAAILGGADMAFYIATPLILVYLLINYTSNTGNVLFLLIVAFLSTAYRAFKPIMKRWME